MGNTLSGQFHEGGGGEGQVGSAQLGMNQERTPGMSQERTPVNTGTESSEQLVLLQGLCRRRQTH